MTSSQGLWWRGEEGVAKQLTLTHPFREQHCTKLHGQTRALISLHESPDNSHYCMHVHLCGAHTFNYKTITFVLSFPLSTWTDTKKCWEHFFFVTFHRWSTEAHTHSLRKSTVLYIISYLVTPTVAANDCLAFIPLHISPLQPCISAVITIHTDFIPSCFNIQPIVCKKAAWKLQRQNTPSKTQGMGVKRWVEDD